MNSFATRHKHRWVVGLLTLSTALMTSQAWAAKADLRVYSIDVEGGPVYPSS